ncbi:hypothetical protein ACFL3C_04835 [Patescibacteria group bacterium]
MNDHKFKLLTLAIVGVIGISIALVAPNPSIAAPPGNPPTANVSPNFTDVDLSGDLDVFGSIKNTKTLTVPGPPCGWSPWPFWQCTGPTSTWHFSAFVNDGLDVNGHLQANSIGKITVRSGSASILAGLHGGATASCYSSEIRLSCGGGFNAGLNMNLNYIQPLAGTTTSCIAYATNNTGSTRTINAYATCLDPDGV